MTAKHFTDFLPSFWSLIFLTGSLEGSQKAKFSWQTRATWKAESPQKSGFWSQGFCTRPQKFIFYKVKRPVFTGSLGFCNIGRCFSAKAWMLGTSQMFHKNQHYFVLRTDKPYLLLLLCSYCYFLSFFKRHTELQWLLWIFWVILNRSLHFLEIYLPPSIFCLSFVSREILSPAPRTCHDWHRGFWGSVSKRYEMEFSSFLFRNLLQYSQVRILQYLPADFAVVKLLP